MVHPIKYERFINEHLKIKFQNEVPSDFFSEAKHHEDNEKLMRETELGEELHSREGSGICVFSDKIRKGKRYGTNLSYYGRKMLVRKF